MADQPSTQLWVGRALFILLAMVIVFVQLLPLDTRPDSWAPPDILLACTLAWVARRPKLIPVYLIAAIFLLTDLMFQRPPGLWAALVVILSEILRARSQAIRNMPLVFEWGMVAFGIVAITIANRIMLAIVVTPQAPLGLTLMQMVMTIAVYPAILTIARIVFGVARPSPGQTNSLGHHL